MTHDPLCSFPLNLDICDCKFIAKVREDERRERMELEEGIAYLKGHFDQAERRGRNIGIQDCIAAVEVISWDAQCCCAETDYGLTLAALRALQEVDTPQHELNEHINLDKP